MERNGDVPVVILFCSLHTLKKVVWDRPREQQSPYVAEILVSKEFNVKTFPQTMWVSCEGLKE